MEVIGSKTMEPRVITTRQQHKDALNEIERLIVLDPGKGTPDGDRLELMALLVANYEEKNFPIENPTPLEAIKFRMEEQGLSPRDLEPFLGSRSKVSEVLSGKVPLSLRYEYAEVLAIVEPHLKEAERYAELNSRGQLVRDIRRCIDNALYEIETARAMDRIP